jgi:hypothetical protein
VVYPVPIKCQLPNIITPINKVKVGITVINGDFGIENTCIGIKTNFVSDI